MYTLPSSLTWVKYGAPTRTSVNLSQKPVQFCYCAIKTRKCVKCLAYDHAGGLYTGIHFTLAAVIWLCWCYVGRNFGRVLQRATVPTEPRSSKDTFRVPKLVKSSFQKMHKCIVVFKCLNNLVPKYLVQYFTRNGDLHNHATRRRKDLHPPKPKRNMGRRTFKYEGAMDFNSSPSCVQSATSLNSF